ncbi:MAG: hypothetical protein JOY98_00600 [Candidatus Eremiobacteraeota bacterium]|nr:hypothetical protein [Candidatus Eremiobacteraeota bacterium]
MIRRTLVMCATLALSTPLCAQAARYANAVEKRVVITGDAAASLASLFGMAPAGTSSLSLQFGKGDAWAIYLLKHDTKQEITNGDGPPRFDTVTFSKAAVSTLTIAPYWLDLGTRAPDPQPGSFSVTSPFVADGATDSWGRLLGRLRDEPGWTSGERPEFRRCFASADKTQLCIEIYAATDYESKPERQGYIVVITASR